MKVTFYVNIAKGQIDQQQGLMAETNRQPDYGFGKSYSFEVDIPDNVLYVQSTPLAGAENFKEII